MKERREKNQTTNSTNYRLILKGRKNSEKKIIFQKEYAYRRRWKNTENAFKHRLIWLAFAKECL